METGFEINDEIETWKHDLKTHDFCFSRSKTSIWSESLA